MADNALSGVEQLEESSFKVLHDLRPRGGDRVKRSLANQMLDQQAVRILAVYSGIVLCWSCLPIFSLQFQWNMFMCRKQLFSYLFLLNCALI